MVLPSSAADPGAAQARAWLDTVTRQLELAQRQILIALKDGSPTQLEALVRAISTSPPWAEESLEVCLRAPELLTLEPNRRVLLRVRLEDLDWLNLHRPLFSDRQLRVVLWCEGVVLEALMRRAVDFFDWISRIVTVPHKPAPDFAIEGVRLALSTGSAFCWWGERLDDVLDQTGIGARVRLHGDRPYTTMIEALAKPGLPVVSGISSERDAWRVRMALAQVGRRGSWIALQPAVEIHGMWPLHDGQVDWELGASRLKAAGWSRAALMAAWLGLESERIEAACEHPNQGLRPSSDWDIDEVAATRAPAYVLRARAADSVVAMARAKLQEGTEPSEEAARVIWSAGPSPWTRPSEPSVADLVRGMLNSGEVPSEELVDNAAGLGFEDVGLELELARFEANQRIRPDRVVPWLAARGRTDRATRLCRVWLESARREGREGAMLPALGWAGDLSVKMGQSERAREWFEQGKQIAEGMRDIAYSSKFIVRLGDCHQMAGETAAAQARYDEARVILEQALRIDDDEHLESALARVYGCLGKVAIVMGELGAARRHQEVALSHWRRLDGRSADARTAHQ